MSEGWKEKYVGLLDTLNFDGIDNQPSSESPEILLNSRWEKPDPKHKRVIERDFREKGDPTTLEGCIELGEGTDSTTVGQAFRDALSDTALALHPRTVPAIDRPRQAEITIGVTAFFEGTTQRTFIIVGRNPTLPDNQYPTALNNIIAVTNPYLQSKAHPQIPEFKPPIR